jgi:hypothetical protein
MYHYTYMITVKNPTDARRLYIGVRSCKVPPEQDTYYGSCRPFCRWQKEHGVDGLHKQILAVWKSRDDALSHEVLLHDCFDVGVNVEFWNQAKQLVTKFDTAGVSHPAYNKGMKWTEEQRKNLSEVRKGRVVTEETRRKISEAQKGRKMPEERRLKFVGKKASEESKQKMRLAKLGKPSWSLGKTFTEEHRQNLSAARKGIPSWNKGLKYTEERKAQMSEIAKRSTVTRQRNEKGHFI